MTQPAPRAKDNDISAESPGFEPLTTAELLQEEDQVLAIQKLLNSNEMLLARVSRLESSLNECYVQSRIWEQQATQSTRPQGLSLVPPSDSGPLPVRQLSAHQNSEQTPGQNPEEMTVETQADPVALLTQQLECSLQRVADFERNSVLQQQRYREQAQRLRQLEQDHQLLQRRLQREQNHTLQLKTALEKTLREQQEDPGWLEQIWAQLNREGNIVESAPAIASWVAEPPLPAVPETSVEEPSLGLDIEALVAQMDSDEDCPWSASQVLFLDEQDEFLSPSQPAPLELPMFGLEVAAAAQPPTLPQPIRVEPPQPQVIQVPPAPQKSSASCSFQLTGEPAVRPASPQPVPQRPAPALDLPPFLRRH